jgi:hypothetical protein
MPSAFPPKLLYPAETSDAQKLSFCRVPLLDLLLSPFIQTMSDDFEDIPVLVPASNTM